MDNTTLSHLEPEGPVFRITVHNDTWEWPDWAYAKSGTFDGRFDDPQSEYRVLYASTTKYGACLEVLGEARLDSELVPGQDQIADDERDADFPSLPPGQIPSSWITSRTLGKALWRGSFVDLGHSTVLQWIKRRADVELKQHNLDRLDSIAAAIRVARPRIFTQTISRWIYDEDTETYSGIRYLSRYGDDVTNFALYETRDGDCLALSTEPLAIDDPDLARALDTLGVEISHDSESPRAQKA